MNILFVCTGNTCRSPMAEALFRDILDREGIRGVTVASAGLCAPDASPATGLATEVLDNPDSLASHRSQQVDKEILESADLVLTMTGHHSQRLKQDFPGFAGKIYTLMDYVTGQDADIDDPFGQGRDVYLSTRVQLETALEQLFVLLFAGPEEH